MTIHELSNQLYNLSVAGYFNGEKFTRRQLENHIASAFRSALKAGNRYVMEIALPDITRTGNAILLLANGTTRTLYRFRTGNCVKSYPISADCTVSATRNRKNRTRRKQVSLIMTHFLFTTLTTRKSTDSAENGLLAGSIAQRPVTFSMLT